MRWHGHARSAALAAAWAGAAAAGLLLLGDRAVGVERGRNAGEVADLGGGAAALGERGEGGRELVDGGAGFEGGSGAVAGALVEAGAVGVPPALPGDAARAGALDAEGALSRGNDEKAANPARCPAGRRDLPSSGD